MHKSYKQEVRRPQYFDWSFPKETKTHKVEVYEFGKWHDTEVEVDEFDKDNERPMCSHCYGDAHFDGFSNYHCYSCGSWLTQNEIINP